MTVVHLVDQKTARIINEKTGVDAVTEATSYSKVFTGDDQTASGTMKKGDIFVKDDGTVYIAVSTNPASGWTEVPAQT